MLLARAGIRAGRGTVQPVPAVWWVCGFGVHTTASGRCPRVRGGSRGCIALHRSHSGVHPVVTHLVWGRGYRLHSRPASQYSTRISRIMMDNRGNGHAGGGIAPLWYAKHQEGSPPLRGHRYDTISPPSGRALLGTALEKVASARVYCCRGSYWRLICSEQT